MSLSTITLIGVFCAMQGLAQVLFKWGSGADGRWLWGFLGGNLLGLSAVWLIMMLYKSMSPTIAFGLCGGGSFLVSQLALAVVFKIDVSLTQWVGVVAVSAGMYLVAAGKSGAL